MHSSITGVGFERQTAKSRLAIGDKAPYFSLKGTDGKIYSLDNLGDGQALVVVFWSNHCPMCRSYERKITDIAINYKPRQVKFVTISSNDADYYPEDSFEKMVEKSREHGFVIPYVKDETQAIARVFDAACTPEVYIFDAQKILRYHGCIDQDYQNQMHGADHSYGLVNALDLLLAGEEIIPAVTPCYGCTIKWRVVKETNEQGWKY